MPDLTDADVPPGDPSPGTQRYPDGDQERTMTLAWDPTQASAPGQAGGPEQTDSATEADHPAPAQEDVERTVMVQRPALPDAVKGTPRARRPTPPEDIERTVTLQRSPGTDDIDRTVTVQRVPSSPAGRASEVAKARPAPDLLEPLGAPEPPAPHKDAEPTLVISQYGSRQRADSAALALGPGAASPAEGRLPAAGAPDDQLGNKLRRGLGWSFLNNVISRAGVLIIGIALARMLSIDEFGVFALALLAMQFLMSLNDAGMTAALIRWEGDVREVEGTGVTLIMAFSAVLYGLFFVSTPLFAGALHIPEATGFLRVLALTILIDATAAVPTALLTRSFSQGRRTIADSLNLAVWAGLTLWLVATGMGVWGLVLGRLAGNLVGALAIIVLAPRRPLPGFRPDMARRLAADGVPLTGSGFLTFCMLNVDTTITGRMLGPAPLGLYTQAFNLASWPVNMFSFAVRRVSLVGFAQLGSDPERLRTAFARALALLTAVTVPVCALLAVLGAEIIETLQGSKWVPAAEALRFLAVLSIVRVAIEITDDLLVAVGKARIMVRIQTIWLIVLIPVLAVGAHLDGIRGVAAGQLLVAVVIVVPAFCLALRAMEFSLRQIALVLVRPAIGGAVFAAVALLGSRLTSSPLLALVIGGGAATLAYAPIVAPMRSLVRPPREPAQPPAEPAVSG
ncbi:lipopolysaccharide biosynthesis protein [Parafrankia sp. FMc2]|uniref:lipopolysaccharide biosynthesis protein n=1 Tax=Parafrankia sp. FMc2 TaxID=3233196 RepID=UPI0034D39CE5